jgi:FtsH-binding integral membrane protein
VIKKIEKMFSDAKVTAFFASSGLVTFISDNEYFGNWVSSIGSIVFVIYTVWTVANLQPKSSEE